MIENHIRRRLIRLIPLALAAGFLICIGPDKLQHLQAKERWGVLGCVLITFLASSVLGRYLRTAASGASADKGILLGYAPLNRVFRNPVVLHSTLNPEAVADTLRRSIDGEGLPQYMVPWFIRLFRQSGSRPVIGVVESHAFRLRSRNAGPYAPTFFAKWEPEYSGTRIEGQFDLAPLVKVSLRISMILMLVLCFIGIMLNVLDLTAGTHFTKDPDVGLVLSVLFVPFAVGFYLVARKLGSRPDKSVLAFLEQTLAASRVG